MIAKKVIQIFIIIVENLVKTVPPFSTIYLIWINTFNAETIPGDMKSRASTLYLRKETNLIPRIIAQYL